MSEPVLIRASSFGTLFDCPARWLAIHREGRRVPSRANAILGRAVHKGTANFDQERLSGAIPDLAAAMDATAEAVKHPGEDVDWDEDTPEKTTDIAVSLTSKYCRIFAPTVEYSAVEIGVDKLHITDLDIVLTGTVDRVRKTDSGVGIADLKTGKQRVGADGVCKTQGDAGQVGVYELVAEAALKVPMTLPAQIIGMNTAVTPEKQRIAAGTIEGAREVLVGDDMQPGLLGIASKLAHGELIFGNPKSMMCHPRYCPNFKTCFFRR